jgi:hypothetical protein
VAVALPAFAVPIVDVAGIPQGVDETLDADQGLFPFAFVARTLKVYDVPFVSPETMMGLPVPVAFLFPGVEVAV